MVPCYSCHIFGIWWSKEVGGCFKATIMSGNASHKGEQFLWEKGVCFTCFVSIEVENVRSTV